MRAVWVFVSMVSVGPVTPRTAISVPSAARTGAMTQDLYAEGMKVRREVLGTD
jgi:hypothetical protein